MGQADKRRGIAKGALGAIAAALLLLAFATQALAGPPIHLHKEALDIGGFNHACGTAADNEGDVYVASEGESKIKVFGPAHNLLTSIANLNEPCGLAVDRYGTLFVVEKATGKVVRYVPNAYPFVGTPTYGPAETIDSSGAAKGIGVDGSVPATFLDSQVIVRGDGNALYVAKGNHIAVYRNESQRLNLKEATAGSVKLTFKGQTTAAIPFNTTHAQMQTALEALSTIGAGNVAVTGAFTASGGEDPKRDHQITFVGTLGRTDVNAIESDKSALSGGGGNMSVETEGGSDLNEVQSISVAASTTGGTFKLNFGGQTTTSLPYNASAAEVQSALEALSNIAPGDVSVTGGPGASNDFVVTFGGAYATTNVPQITIANSLIPNEVQKVTVDATAGSFKLTFNFQTTAAIAFNASAASLQSALEALNGIDPGDVTVTGGPGGPGGASPYLVTFKGIYAGTNVGQMSANQASLTGTATVATTTEGASIGVTTTTQGNLGRFGQGLLTDATSVAAYTYYFSGALSDASLYLFVAEAATEEVKLFSGPNLEGLKLRATIDSVDHDHNSATPEQEIGFGPGGAQIAVDPGNGDPSTQRCEKPTVVEQACTAGHFLLYDDANGVIDEFEASGEFLDQISSGEFADGEPTGLAIERSGGPGDGTIYATSGAGPGAKLLAFGPLATPSRVSLPELSHVLPQAGAVIVDSYGDVYVSTQTKIHVFAPDGTKLSEFEGPEGPDDLAVDSTGKVYVIDGTSSEPSLTYYTPSAYPPVSGTGYAKHEPPLPTEEARVNKVSVNPADDHVLVGVGSVEPFKNKIIEFGSAKEGSLLKGVVYPFFGFSVSASGLAVHRSSGKVYASDNKKRISVIEANGTELAAQIGGAGSLNGVQVNSRIDVDQSNGHVVDFKAGFPAQEYDASGAFVAEFGTFSAGSSVISIAVDNACALHRSGSGEPEPLSKTTTPTCKEFDPSNGNVYVAFDSANNEVQPYDLSAFGPLQYGEVPIPLTGKADGFGAGNATLHGTVDPRGFDLQECRFEYLSDGEYLTNGKTFAGATSVPCAETPAEIGKGTGAVSVHADLSGLDPEARYRYRLIAKNKYGEVPGKAGLFGPPILTIESALPVGYDEATFRAEVDPSGLGTKYHFEYGTSEAYGQSTPVGELPAGEAAVAIKAPIVGLTEGTEYHFQLVAENEALSVKGPDQTFVTLTRRPAESCPNTEFRIGLSANLPDCRAYELVTPAETRGVYPSAQSSKSGQPYMNSWFVTPRGAGAGENLAFEALPSLPGFDGTGGGDAYRSERGKGAHPAAGWATELYGPSFAQTGGTAAGGHGVSSDQRYWLLDVLAYETPAAETFAIGNYLRVPTGQAEPECSPDPKLEFELVSCTGAEPDLKAEGRFISAAGTHLIFTSNKHLDKEAAPSGTEAIYDREAGSSDAEVISLKPDGSPFEAGEGATYLAATEDGTAVVFRVGGVLYLHRGGQTIEVAAAPNTYSGISEDGKRVFYMNLSYTPLTSSTPPPADLFACDVEAGPCAGPEATHEPIQIAEDSIFVNVSADGSHVFFTSEDALTGPEDENENGETATALAHNLYAWDGSSVSFIALLDPEDLVRWEGEGVNVEEQEDLLQWTNGAPGQDPVVGTGRGFSPTRSTPDGEVLVFQSHAQLGDYDNEGHGEIYRYAPGDAPGSRLNCVSCNPSKAPSSVDALLLNFSKGAVQPKFIFGNTLVPNLTDDGEAVFFQTRSPLLPEDANSATDVYQWKAPGAGNCEQVGGCLALISSGQGEQPSQLFGMSADGHDVFILTTDKLVGGDVPASPSLYDARVEGGIPDPPAKAPCQGDACQGAGAIPPVLPDPASARLGEGGNVSGEEGKQQRCAKGKRRVVRAGKARCVKKRHKRHHKRANANRRAHR